ncbi:hypothetical protein F4777DRAFT_576598 [Nemania sp. FL0916]|nr:hypothetical protein F4777DRAFT_576598 [Nemania sp. FL0916]
MVVFHWILVASTFAQTIIATGNEPFLFASLQERQAPGAPGYDCHKACGQAIIETQSSKDVCNDEVFQSNYHACLECAGPDRFDIWKDYGAYLTGAAEKCDLPTTPASGKPTSTTSTMPTGPVSAEPTTSTTPSSVPSDTPANGTSTAPDSVPTTNAANNLVLELVRYHLVLGVAYAAFR